jgi:hypothetical protein
MPGRKDGLGDLAAEAARASGQEEDLGHATGSRSRGRSRGGIVMLK